jgi:hypothetical protein
MVKSGVGSMRSVIIAALVVGCGEEPDANETPVDAGAASDSCPNYEPNDAGVFLTTRDCPLRIDYAIR